MPVIRSWRGTRNTMAASILQMAPPRTAPSGVDGHHGGLADVLVAKNQSTARTDGSSTRSFAVPHDPAAER